MYISRRLLKVIEFLKNNQETTIKNVAEKCNITERMVRYDIENLNFLLRLNNIPEIEKLPKGGLLVSEDFILSKKVNDFKDLNKYSKEERIEYVKAKLLIEGKINLSAISKELNVSRTSIRSDVVQVIKEIETNNLKVVNNVLVSNERNIRNLITKYFSKDLLRFQNKAFGEKEEGLLENYLSELIIDISQKKLRNIIESIAYEMKNENINYFSILWLNIIISYIRVKSENIREFVKGDELVKEKESYRVLESYINKLEDILNIKYCEVEKIGIAKCIDGCMSNKVNSYIYENWVDIVLIAKDIINEASVYCGFDLRNDEVLINGLLNHIKPAIYRLIKNISLEIDICMDVIDPYPKLVQMVKEKAKLLENIIQTEVTDSEIVLLTLHILASIERNKNTDEVKKNILLVCGGGYGTTAIVANKIKSNYNANIVDMVSYSDFLQYDVSNINYIVTVLKITEDSYKDIPIIKISPFITENDKILLSKYLSKQDLGENKLNEILEIVNESIGVLDKERLIEDLKRALTEKVEVENNNKTLKDYIKLNKIEIIDKVYSWQESIVRVGEILEKSGDIEKTYVDNIINISETYGVHFVLDNGVVIPHGEVGEHVNNSSISVLYIKEPVKFSYERTGNIFFMIAAKSTKDHVKSIEEINKLSNNEEFISKLKNINKKEELMSLILDYSK